MAAVRKKSPSDPNTTRMTLAQHLDELRGCLVRSLIALALAVIVCIWPAKYVLMVFVRPVVLALRANGQPDTLLATSPVENIVVYIKVVVFSALVLAGPYVILQFWRFVAVGLYAKEKAWVHKLVPISVGLFFTGVAFMYVFALVISLNFLVGFSGWLPLPKPEPTLFERSVLKLPGKEDATTQPTTAEWPTVPLLAEEPQDPPAGAVWFDVMENRLKVHEREQTYSYQFQRDDHRAMVTTHFKIGEYLTFVLVLTVAFGLAFQMPLVVVFLVRSGLVPAPTFRKYRKFVILVIVFIAGMLAPPDLLSHLLLSVPMVALFEIGLWVATRRPAQGT